MTEKKNPNMRLLVIIGGLISLINLVAGFLAYPHLPDKVPTHWNLDGEVDGWGTAWQGAFMMPLIMIGVFLLLLLLPKIDPKRKNYANMGKAYTTIVLVIMIFFTVIYFGTLGIALGYMENIPSLTQIGVGALFVILGNYMGKLKHNYFMGIRTPWTLASEEVWYRTHRLAGPFWVLGGLLFMLSSLFAGDVFLKVMLVIIIVLVAIPAVYSFIIFKKLEKEE
jgi:uncharacterized membrane protein